MVKTRSSTGGNDTTPATPQPKCSFEGCIGCFVCRGNTTPNKPTTPKLSITSNTGLTPGKSFADAVLGSNRSPTQTGCSSPGPTRSYSPVYVTPGSNKQCNNLSIRNVNATNEITTIVQSPPSITTKKDSLTTTNKIRNKWTKDEKLELYRCYCIAKISNTTAPATKGTFKIWRERNPEIHPKMTSTTLNTARRYAEKNTLVSAEMINIRKEEEARNTPSNLETPPKLVGTERIRNAEPVAVHKNTANANTRPILEEPTCEESTSRRGTDSIIDVAEEGLTPNSTNKYGTRSKSSTVMTTTQEREPEEDEEVNVDMMFNLINLVEQYKYKEMNERLKPRKFTMTAENREKLKDMNHVLTIYLKTKEPVTITELNTIHYAAAVALAGTVNNQPKVKNLNDPDEIIKKKIKRVRKWIGKLTAATKNNTLTKQVKEFIGKDSVTTVLVTEKMKLAALAKKLRVKIEARKRYKNNKLYRCNKKAFYAGLRTEEGNDEIADPPRKEAIADFWGKLWGSKGGHNKDAQWLREEREEMKDIKRDDWKNFTHETLTETVKKVSNWKAPGIDQVQNFWLKHLHALHPALTEAANDILTTPETSPAWLTNGTTTLLHKSGPTNDARNYRPITCLPTYYKLITLMLTDKIYQHVVDSGILPPEQKGIMRKARGCKDQLMLDKIITEDAKLKKRNLSTMWIDYKKAYDSVPHEWMLECLSLYKIDTTIQRFIKVMIKQWKTNVHLHSKEGRISTDTIFFRRGIFQGDSLSPLLFCLALTPISRLLRRNKVGYTIEKMKVNNLLYIDDLKVFAKGKEEMEKCRALIKMFSDDIKMEFGLSKCAVIHINKGTIVNSPDVIDIPLLSTDDNYKYLGILQTDIILHDKMKEKAKKEYYHRVRDILKADINSSFTMDAIKTYAMPILRYGFGILKWTQGEIRAIDTKTRKVLTKYGFHHPRSSLHRLYLSRKMRGRGLIGAMDCFKQELTALAAYLKDAVGGNDPFARLVAKIEAKKVYGIMSYADGGTRNRNTKETNNYHDNGLREKKLHGDYFTRQNDMPNVDIGLSYTWLNNAYFRFQTESLICAAQEQALATKYISAKIWKNGNDKKCRLCGEHDETVHHIVSGCKMLAANQYKFRHDQVGKYIHWWILKDLGAKVTDSWMKHVPTEITTYKNKVIMWDKAILTDKKVKCNRPDITIHDTEKRECIFVDMAVPVCVNVIRKEAEKITKYRDLEIEVQKCWNLRKVRTVPIVIGALGTVSKGILDYTKILSKNIRFCTMQKTALLGTAHILRNFLTPLKNSSP